MIPATIQRYLTGAALITTAICGAGWYITDAKLDSCREGRKADAMAYEAAAADSLALHMQQIKDKEDEYRAKATKADADYGALHDRYRQSLRVFAEGNQRASGATVATADNRGSQGDNGPGEGSEFLAVRELVVPTSDLAICAENTARLVIAREWALGLNETD